MILISNVGNRDVQYKGEPLYNGNIRQESEKLLNNYEDEKENLSYPIIKPYLESFANKLKNIYLFVTNQEDERVRNSDTLHFGGLIKKWIEEKYGIKVNVVQYANNPTDYEGIYDFFTSYFSQERNNFDKADKRIISLSGGTPQMNGALYIILSSMYARNNEFYSVFGFNGKLIPVNHERTINKIFVKKSCIDLLNIYQYQSIIEILNSNEIENRRALIEFLSYANFRKFFDFEKAYQHLENFMELIPTSIHGEFQFLNLNGLYTQGKKKRSNKVSDHKLLIKELLWNIEISYKNQNYLFLVALLFRIEEALLFEIVNYLFRAYFSEQNKNLTDKMSHPGFINYLKSGEGELWSNLQGITYKGKILNINPNELSRPVLFYIAKLKMNELEVNEQVKGKHLKQIKYLLEIFDKITKYCFDLIDDDEKEEKYKHRTMSKCLGDLRNSSIIAHGFDPVSKDKIEYLYGESLEYLLSNLKKHNQLFADDAVLPLDNIFDKINGKLLNFILEL